MSKSSSSPKPAPREHTAQAQPGGASVDDACTALAHGQPVLIVGQHLPEIGASLVLAAAEVTGRTLTELADLARGIVCAGVSSSRLEALGLRSISRGVGRGGPASLHEPVDHRDAARLGVSASGRAKTIRSLADPATKPADLRSPGHVLPVACDDRGVLGRPGILEAALDLCKLAGAGEAVAGCQILDSYGEPATAAAAFALARWQAIPALTVDDVLVACLPRATTVAWRADAQLPTTVGQFLAIGYEDMLDGSEHLALVAGDPTAEGSVVSIHVECLTGAALGSCNCQCRARLDDDLARLSAHGSGVLVYLRYRHWVDADVFECPARAVQPDTLQLIRDATARQIIDDVRQRVGER